MYACVFIFILVRENRMVIAIPVIPDTIWKIIIVTLVKLIVRHASQPFAKLVLMDTGEIRVNIVVAITVHHVTKETGCAYLVRMGIGVVHVLLVDLNVEYAVSQTDDWSVMLDTNVTNTIVMAAKNVKKGISSMTAIVMNVNTNKKDAHALAMKNATDV
ncbi:hypothetical protein MAR_031304 [Mya arenaria]|uniref:Uncharacterized protein n=1 Tax=Mya arenaria TaxID=6604 RepID=A0ABY7F3J2_MYAAR|nr:hypothetical protein MAR_031304 [Mya arenaria]